MKPYIPFVNTTSDYQVYERYYTDAEYIRLSLENSNNFYTKKNSKLWIDPAVDGCYHSVKDGEIKEWNSYLKNYDRYELLIDEKYLTQPNKDDVNRFISSSLNACFKHDPSLITVPQVPVIDTTSKYNKINRMLAEATHVWKTQVGFKGEFVLPLIFTHQNQLKGKTEWNKKITIAKSCKELSSASFIWIVDSTLSDQNGSDTLESRFKKLVEFHKDIKDEIPNCTVIVGPYWGMNMVLWSKNLGDYSAICLGSGYKYRISGAFKGGKANKRIALPPLRRWAVANSDLRKWIDKILQQLPPDEESYKELKKIRDNYNIYTSGEAKIQIAVFYKKWFDKIHAVSENGRALALYQDLSMSYMLGKRLIDQGLGMLPEIEKTARDPSKIAQQLMLQCL